jgi:hypothetical protein
MTHMNNATNELSFESRFNGATIRRSTVEKALAAAQGGDHQRVIALLSGSHLGDAWALAMTAHHGPVGIHESRLGADGRPSAETLAEIPSVGERMARAAERLVGLLGWYLRVDRCLAA